MNQRLDITQGLTQGQLLSNGDLAAGQYNFWGDNDTRELWLERRSTQPSNWAYRDRVITYTINSQNYRCAEWDQIDWANSVAIYGCSLVFGDGLDDRDTVSSQLSKMINRPVINLGAGGSSAQWLVANQTQVLTHYAEPWATVCLWPDAGRSSTYWEVATPNKWGSWNIKQNNWSDLWNRGRNPGTQFYLNRQVSRLMHKNKWIEATYSEPIADLINCKLFTLDDVRAGEPARDLAHPGRATAQICAKWIAENLRGDMPIEPRSGSAKI